jgi:Zn-finger nucleic acid-binding protein
MKCPLDKSDMIVVEHQRIELDYCLKCAGVWLDAGELDLLVSTLKTEGTNSYHPEILTPETAKVSETKRKCPVCRKNMDKVWIGKDPKVLIDSCPIGDGLWFDGGELSQVLCEVTNGETRDVISFLGKAFAAGCSTNEENKKL